MSAETAVEEHREQIANRLGEPDRLQFPSGWAMSSSWRRAQTAPSQVGAASPAEFDVLLGYVDDGAKHRVLFALYEGELAAECECDRLLRARIAGSQVGVPVREAGGEEGLTCRIHRSRSDRRRLPHRGKRRSDRLA